MQGYVLNTRRELFRDRQVREALTWAFDFERSNQTLFYGQYRRTRSYFDNSDLAATGLPSPAELELLEPYRERLPPEVFSKAYSLPETDGSGRIRSHLREAQKLLAAAGWKIIDGKLVHAERGTPFAFEALLVSPLFERITLPYAQNLERLGITARVRTVDAAQYIKRLETFDFDVIVFVWGQSLSPGNEQRNFWGSDAAQRNGSRNFAGISDPVVDALIDKLVAAPDRTALVTRARALDRVLQWGHYVVPHWHIDYDRVLYWNKFGRPQVTPISGVQFGAWWVDPAKEERLRGRIKSVPR
jgi:microcin C transport system substrate-binding protein